MVSIKIIAGSTRPGRFNPQVAHWVQEQTKGFSDKASFELVDLAAVNLPLLDEADAPATGKKSNDHTKKWSEIVGSGDGFIVVSPEYNHSMPAALKNAFDYLFYEWNYKPVTYVSYGSLAGGARAVEHLRGIAGELKMYDLREQLLIPNYWNNMSEEGKYQFTEEQAALLHDMTTSLVFWAEHMKAARQELAS